jgi:hypothetical protein
LGGRLTGVGVIEKDNRPDHALVLERRDACHIESAAQISIRASVSNSSM